MLSISVVTPSFNHAEFISDTIESVLNQDYPELEYIIIDGGSTDGTLSILSTYKERVSCIVSEPDEGQTDALQKGFQLATGEIQAWLNSDDLYAPGTLREVANYFDSNPEVDFVYGDGIWIDRSGAPLREKREISYHRFIWLNYFNYIPQPSAFWRSTLYQQVGGLDPNYDLAMDGDLFDRFAKVTTPRHVNRIWSYMRLYPEQKNQAFRARSDEEDDLIRQRNNAPTTGVKRSCYRFGAKCYRIGLKLVGGCYQLTPKSQPPSALNDAKPVASENPQ